MSEYWGAPGPHHLKKGSFPPPVLAFPSPQWAFPQPDGGQKSVFPISAWGRAFTKPSRDHLLAPPFWSHTASSSWPPPQQGMALSPWGLCDGPQQTAACSAVHSSDSPGSQDENKQEVFGTKSPKGLCLHTCPEASGRRLTQKKREIR